MFYKLRLWLIRKLLGDRLEFMSYHCVQSLQMADNHAQKVEKGNPTGWIKWDDHAWHAYHYGRAELLKDMLKQLEGRTAMQFSEIKSRVDEGGWADTSD